MMTETRFKLKDFDGPLDLLLALIGKAQIDIREIFVSEITDQYLQIVREEPDLDMDEASDFLVMAATLMEIKSRAMLPKPPKVEENEEDPEEALIRQLEEYKRFRETAEEMKDFEDAARRVFTKLPEEFPLPAPEIEITGLDLDGLYAAMLRILSRRPEEAAPEENHYAPRNIRRDSHTVQECMLTLMKDIQKKRRMSFEEAFSSAPTREEVVTFFLALLELLKLGRMHLRQTEIYGEIELIAGKAEDPENTDMEEEPTIGKRKRRKTRKEDLPDADGNSSEFGRGEYSGTD